MSSLPRHPLSCILPNYMLKNLANSGSPSVRERAINAISLSSRVRGQRDVRAVMAVGMSAGEKRLTIYNAHNETELPGKIVRREGDPDSGDLAVDEAYKGLGATYDLYYDVFKRNSLDDNGFRLDATVHYGDRFNNAFWNGMQMVFGDGDEDIFNRFTIAIDVIGHELTHGVVDFTCNLVYKNQSGALNEHFADVFGSLVKQHSLDQTADEADWLIGAGLFTPQVKGKALRSMSDPGTAYDDPMLGKDPQPNHMSKFVKTTSDYGGVHINSGILNRAFFLVAKAIGGEAWEAPGQIWYTTMLRLTTNSQFLDCAQITYNVAGELYGSGSHEQQAVAAAWDQVGLKVARAATAARAARRNGERARPQPMDLSTEQFEKLVEAVANRVTAEVLKKVGRPVRT